MSFDATIQEGLAAVREIAGHEITYHRGDAWVQLRAVPGQTNFQLSDVSNIIHEARTRDFTFFACKLVLNAQLVTPNRGDLIHERVGRNAYIYEISRPDGGDQPWRYADHAQTTIRVHTNLKRVVSA